MQIVITLDANDPPEGALRVDGAPERKTERERVVAFEGWIDLVAKLYEVLGPREARPRPGRT